MLKKLFGGSSQRLEAHEALYMAAVAKARDPRLYLDHGVADNVDGRFDLIVLHVMLVIRRLRAADEVGKQVSQALFDYMFHDMDRSLREMGVGDLGISHHIKRMAKAFYARAETCETGLDAAQSGDLPPLIAALRATIYRSVAEAPGAPGLAAYLLRLDRHVQGQDASSVAGGVIDLNVPATEGSAAP